MNNQIDPRFALRALFEASLIAQIESGKLDEGFFDSVMTGVKRFGTRLGAAKSAFQGNIPQAQRQSNVADRMESQSQKIGRQDQQLAANRKSRALANIASMQSKRKAAAANKKTDARRAAQANYKAGAATPEQKKAFMQTASTDHYRLGLKSLFEAILVEEDFVYNTKNSDLFKKKA